MASNDKEDYCGNESVSKVSNIRDAKLSFQGNNLTLNGQMKERFRTN